VNKLESWSIVSVIMLMMMIIVIIIINKVIYCLTYNKPERPGIT